MSENSRPSGRGKGSNLVYVWALCQPIWFNPFFLPPTSGATDLGSPWDGVDFAIGLCAGSAFVAGWASVLILARPRLRANPDWGAAIFLAAIYLNHGLGRLLTGRPGVAPGFAAIESMGCLALWTYVLARAPARRPSAPRSSGQAGFLIFTLMWTSIYWCARATRVEGCGPFVGAFAALVGARLLAGIGLSIRDTFVDNRREIEAYRARRRAAGAARTLAPAVPPGA